MTTPDEPIFFESGAAFRLWLEANHNRATELLLGFHKVASGKNGITYPEALDETLCFGWIDGVRRGVDEGSYTIRFTPRRAQSIWSAVNLKRIGELIQDGRVQPPGLQAYQAHDPQRSPQYSYERQAAQLAPEYEATFRANRPAWDFFQAQPPGYQRSGIWWITSAKQEPTRQRRLALLIDACEKRHRMPELIGAARATPRQQT